MAKPALISLIKPLEATKLNPRNGLPLGGPDVTVFFGSLIEYVGPDQDRERFKYLNELYSVKREAFLSATGGGLKAKSKEAPPPIEEAEAEPEPEPEPEAMEAIPSPPRAVLLEWHELPSNQFQVRRAAVPGGWLLTLDGANLVFLADPRHQWDGGSVA